jgi:uncharacterized repeat protein (TIGR01451 family)
MLGIRRIRLFPAIFLSLLAAGISLAPNNAAAASTLLLSNLDRQPGDPSSAYICSSIWDAAPFVTGDQTTLLGSVTLPVLKLGGAGRFWVVVYADDNGVPGLPVQNGILNGPAHPGGQVTYYATGELRLAPNTRYWLAGLSDEPLCSGWGYGWYMTMSWDYSGYPGWELPHYGAYSMDGGATWVSTESAMIPRPFYYEISGTVLADAGPALSVSDGTAPGGSLGTNAQAFALRLSRPSLLPVSVDFKTVAGWASTNTFEPATGTATFPPGTTNQTITITITGDTGTNQTYRLQLLRPTNAVLANFEAIGTITNDAPLPEVLVRSASVKESNVRSPTILAMVTLSRPSAVPVSVQFSTLGLTATAGQDFIPTNGTLTFGGTAPLTQWVPVRVRPNLLTEADKTLTLELTQPTNCVVSSTPGILTIENDDGLPGVVDHFSVVPGGPALGGMPCPVTVTALDADGQVVSNFSERVFFMAGYSNSPPQHFGFEEGELANWSWLPGSPQPGSYDLLQFDTTQPGATNYALRMSPSYSGDTIQRQVYLEGGRGYYISASFAQGSATPRIILDSSELAASMSLGQAARTNVMVYYDAWYSYSRYFSLACKTGVFVDDVVFSAAPFQSVWSGAFTNGVWTGTVTFPGQATDVMLFAEDTERHSGSSSPLTVLPTPNLTVGAALALGLGRVGEPLTFTISVTNVGQAAASAVVVSNRFSPGVQVTAATTTLGSCTNLGTNVLCNIPSLAVGQKATLTITARATDTNLCSFQAAVSSNDPDPNPSNNTAGLTFSVGLPGLRSASITVHGAAGGTNLVFPVSLGGPFAQPVSVQYRTWAGVNPPPGDFIQTNGTLIFQPGMTNLAVRVAVLDDGVYEGTQYCDLILENPVNAVFLNGNWFDGTIVEYDPAPSLAIDDVGVVEGDAGETEAVFTVRLSGATAIPASVQFATANGTALAGSDYFSTNGTLTFAPGTNAQTVRVRVRGNTVNEPNETFFVNLSAPVDATIARAQGVGTITNDDLVAGRLDHFAWAPVFSPQIPQRSLQVSVSALDAFGQLVTNFTGTVPLSAATSGGATNLGLTPSLAGPFVGGAWAGAVWFTNTGTQVVLRADDGQEHIGLSNPFNVLAKFPLAVALPPAATEGAGSLLNQGRVWFPQPETNDVEVALTTTNLNLIAVPASVLIPAGQTSALFTITIADNALLDGTRTAYVSTVSTQYSNATASMLIYDNETASLAVALPAQVTEGTSGTKAGVGTVTVSAMPDAGILVLLTSSNPTRLQVPSSVTIPPGTNAASFTLTAPDNNRLDGKEAVTVTASVQNWNPGSGVTLVTDNESHTLELYAGNYVVVDEGLGTRTNAIRLTLGGMTVSNLVVNLASTDTTELVVPASVTVPAGTNSAYFNFTVVDDSETDGTQSVGVLASAPGFTNGSITITVRDNDLHHFNFGVFSGAYTSGVPFLVYATAADTNNTTLTKYGGVIMFRAVGSRGPFTIGISSASGWVRGTWNGYLVINTPYAQGFSLEAMDSRGHSGRSAFFNVALPAWAGSPRILETRVVGPDLVVRFETVAGTHYALESALGLPQGSWLAVGAEVIGDGGILSLTHPNGAGAQARFYRLRVTR